MADEKTQTVHARLIKGFSAPQHRRAGHVFTPGPEYQAVEVTKEGLAALQDDPSIELAESASEAKRVNAQYQPKQNLSEAEKEGSTDRQQDPDNVSGEKDTGATHARRYANPDPTRSDSPEAGFNAPPPPEGESDDSDEEKLDTLSRNDLNKAAIAEGVVSPEKLANKQEVIEAILERRNGSNGSDEAESANENKANPASPDPDAGKPAPEDEGTDKAPAADPSRQASPEAETPSQPVNPNPAQQPAGNTPPNTQAPAPAAPAPNRPANANANRTAAQNQNNGR